MTIVFEHPTLIMGKMNSYSGGVFDAYIDTECCSAVNNAELTILMRVHFYDGSTDATLTTGGKVKDVDGNEFNAYPWAKGELEQYIKGVVSTAQKFWHGRFWLETPSSYTGLHWPKIKSTHRPNVWCRFELEAAPVKAGSHFSIACINLGKEAKKKGTFFRSHMLLYDSNDPINTKRHEVGHLLGLDHPRGANNNAAAYADKAGSPGDIMGSGTKIYPHHALPWQKAISFITETKKDDWKVHQRKIPPKRIT